MCALRFLFADTRNITHAVSISYSRPRPLAARLCVYIAIEHSQELSHKSYRPLTVLTFRANFWFHGLNPIGYHAINLGLHSIVSILFYK